MIGYLLAGAFGAVVGYYYGNHRAYRNIEQYSKDISEDAQHGN